MVTSIGLKQSTKRMFCQIPQHKFRSERSIRALQVLQSIEHSRERRLTILRPTPLQRGRLDRLSGRSGEFVRIVSRKARRTRVRGRCRAARLQRAILVRIRAPYARVESVWIVRVVVATLHHTTWIKAKQFKKKGITTHKNSQISCASSFC